MGAARRRKLAQKTLKRFTKLEKFVGQTQEDFGELGLTDVAFGADLASAEILAAIERVRGAKNVIQRKGRLGKLGKLLKKTEAGQRFVAQAKAGKEKIGEEGKEDILARLTGRKVRRTAAKRIQAGRAITRRTGGLGLLGQAGG